MRRVVIDRAGGYDRLRLEHRPDPRPMPGEVRVQTAAIGVNYADCVVRMGLYASAKKYVGWPITPGFEFAGTIDALGEGVDGLAVGAPVLGVTRFGGYASHLCVPAHQVFALPQGMEMRLAAGFPAVFLTAYFALEELARPRRGATILVHSASGGVGGALVQLGRLAGCRVVGVVGGAHKIAEARRLGADVVIDKSAGALWRDAERAAPAGFDVVLDANGRATLAQSYAHLRSPGRLVVYGFHSMLPRRGGRPDYLRLLWDVLWMPRFSPLAMTGTNRSVMAFNLSYLFEQRDVLARGMAALLNWYGEGRLVAPTVTEYPLEAVADAHRALESGRTVGKLILRP